MNSIAMKYFSKLFNLAAVLFTAFIGINNASGQTVWNFSYTGSEQSITLLPGTYKIQTWGEKVRVTIVDMDYFGYLCNVSIASF